jgi:hypothetical protein
MEEICNIYIVQKGKYFLLQENSEGHIKIIKREHI